MLKEMVQITEMYHFEILSPIFFFFFFFSLLVISYTNILTFLLFWSLTNAVLNYCHYFKKLTFCSPQKNHKVLEQQ